jgi:hypothetical protein
MPRRPLRDDGNDRRHLRKPLPPATPLLRRRRYSAARLLLGTYTIAIIACAPWARGPRLSPATSGLVGEWAAPAPASSTDTTVLRFDPDGNAEEVRLRPGHEGQRIPLGPFRVYADTGRVRLLCFSYRRGRNEPACRYFEVDPLIDESGRVRRQLQLLNWVADGSSQPERWMARTP